MQFTVASLVALAAAGANALPSVPRQEGKVAPGTPFTVAATVEGADIEFPFFYASKGGILLNDKDTGATCDNAARASSAATFNIDAEGNGFLYSTDNPPQQLFVDRSGMGQGIFGYTTGAQSGPRNGERTGWAVDDANNLTFDGASFIACPNGEAGDWSVWVSAGVSQPGGSSGCLPVSAVVTAAADPNSCTYSQ